MAASDDFYVGFMTGVDDSYPILVARNGTLWQVSVGQSPKYHHYFGGPLDLSVGGLPKNERPLHRVVTLDLTDRRLDVRIPGLSRLPLVYGFVYSSPVFKYQILSEGKVRIIEMSPRTSSDDWPYENYPDQFGVKPLAFGPSRKMSRKKIRELTCQGLDANAPDQLVVVVTPKEDFGVSLWGPDGDAEMVELIFQVDPESGLVSVSNQCT
jgi:hypothetical protein